MTTTRRRAVYFDAYPHTVGGVARVGVLLAATLAERAWQLEVILPADGPAAAVYRDQGIATRIVEAPIALRRYGRQSLRGTAAVSAAVSLPRYWWRLSRAMAGSDLVHVNDARGLIVAGPAARVARARLVWQVHSQIDGPALGWLATLLGATVAVVSRAVTPRGLLRRARVHLLPNTSTQTASDIPMATGDEHPPVVLCIGRMHPEKGFDMLLAASAVMRRQHVPHRMVLVGGAQEGHDDYQDALQQTARALGVADDVEFVGAVDETTGWLGRASVYVQPSRREAFGLAVLEAMQAGLPVVATSVGGLPELVDDGVTGRLVRSDDPDALAAAITTLINDPALRRVWGDAGRRRADEQFGLGRFRAGVHDLYAAATVRP